jgi:hypothetical protein
MSSQRHGLRWWLWCLHMEVPVHGDATCDHRTHPPPTHLIHTPPPPPAGVHCCRDQAGTSLPVRLAVDKSYEPNVSTGAKPLLLTGTVTVSGLTPGKAYALLRFNSYASVPTSGGADAFLGSEHDRVVEFIPTGQTWTYVDPVKIVSSGMAYYRCVLLQGRNA